MPIKKLNLNYRDGGITLMNRQNGAEVVDFEYAYVSGSNRLDYVWNNEAFDLDADLSHDRNGNITNGRGITATTYDWRNLPLSITTTNPVYPFTPITHTYRYDHNGHRVYSSVDQTYTVRGAFGEPIAEYAGSTPVLKYWNYVRPDGVVIGRKEGSNRFFYHRDHLGSTRTVLSQHTTPTVVETYDYMPFGEFMSGRITTSGTGTRPKYTGHEFDDETDLHNMQWRRQIPRYGVFRTPDPMADSYPGWNSYAYVMNDPMRLTDPTGLCPEDMWFGSVCKVWEMYKQVLINSLKSISAVPQNDSQEEIQRVSEEKTEARQVAHASTYIAEAVNQTMDVYSLFLPGYGATRAAVEGDVGGALLEAGLYLIPGGKLVSVVKKDASLLRLAREAGSSHGRSLNNLLEQLSKGNMNPGLGSKRVFGDVFEARARDGGRVYFRESGSVIEIVGYSNKQNQSQVINRLMELYK